MSVDESLTPERPRVVAMGGGHGAAQSLRAIRHYAGEVTAVVSVSDDGGSSGRLRDQLGIPAPGDLRRCISALLPDGSSLASTLEHRFGEGELEGHAFGNLLIAALSATTGDFARGVSEAARLVGALGTVFPATTVPVVLKGSGTNGEVAGQVTIKRRGGISRVHLDPPCPPSPPGAIDAILAADQVVLGPGSLYTSLLAVTAVPALREALAATAAQRVYVANLSEQHPETEGFDVGDHVDALIAHGVQVDVVLADEGGLVTGRMPDGVSLVRASLTSGTRTAHEPELLARALEDLMVVVKRVAGEQRRQRPIAASAAIEIPDD